MSSRRIPSRRVTSASVILALGAALSLPGDQALANRSEPAPTVAKVTKVIGARPAVMTVWIPEGARLADPPPILRGNGRFIGVLLVNTRGGFDFSGSFDPLSSGDFTDGDSILFGRYGFCERPGCDPGDTAREFNIARGRFQGSDSRLEAGKYALFLFTDGAPVEVTLRFEGLSGRTTLRPSRAIDTNLTMPEVRFNAPGNIAYADETKVHYQGFKGFAFQVLRISGELSPAARFGHCVYATEPLLPPTLAYITPGCPGGLSVETTEVQLRTSPFLIDDYWQAISDPGDWWVGHFYQAPGIINRASALFFWMDVPHGIVAPAPG